MSNTMAGAWLGLLIGNSQLHWGRFEQGALVAHWKQPHFDPAQPQSDSDLGNTILKPTVPPLDTVPAAHRPLLLAHQVWLASVVPQQTSHWQPYCQAPVTLEQVPLQGTYPTLGVDRALALWGAGARWGFPVLVVDGGTALTYTGADAIKTLVGGAILPGLGLQLRSLHQSTAMLPIVELDASTPRWATTTEGAIQSGIFHSAIAGAESFLRDWRQRFPRSPVVFTGGDGHWLYRNLRAEFRPHSYYDPCLGLRGLQQVCHSKTLQS